MFYHTLITLVSRLKQFSPLRLALLSTTLFDELVAGVPIIGIPLVRDKLGLNYTQVGLLLGIGAFTGVFFEPVLNLLSDRTTKRYWIISSFLLLAAAFVLAGSANSFLVLLAAFALIHLTGGMGLGQSQAVLIDMNPHQSIQTMARWTVMSSIGDLFAPIAITTVVSFQLGWSALCWMAAAIWLGVGLTIAVQRFPQKPTTHETEDQATTSLLANVRIALRHPRFLRWALLSQIPDMADEVFLAFAILYLHDVLHADQIAIGILVTTMMTGSLLSLIILDRFLLHRFTPQRLLRWSAIITLLGLLLFLTMHSLWVVGGALFIISSGATCWYPLAKGQVYALLPGKSGTVRAITGLLNLPFLLLPTIVGFLASHFGIIAGLGFLASAPVLILLLLINM